MSGVLADGASWKLGYAMVTTIAETMVGTKGIVPPQARSRRRAETELALEPTYSLARMENVSTGPSFATERMTAETILMKTPRTTAVPVLAARTSFIVSRISNWADTNAFRKVGSAMEKSIVEAARTNRWKCVAVVLFHLAITANSDAATAIASTLRGYAIMTTIAWTEAMNRKIAPTIHAARRISNASVFAVSRRRGYVMDTTTVETTATSALTAVRLEVDLDKLALQPALRRRHAIIKDSDATMVSVSI